MASSYGTDADKGSLRQEYLTARPQWPQAAQATLDARICDLLADHPFFRDASLVLAYVPVASEVDPTQAILRAWAEGKQVALPRRNAAGGLDFFVVSSLDGLEVGERGITEPAAPSATRLSAQQMVGSVCLVPGLVFDGDGHRIGYGGGHYDAFLSLYPGDKVGLARSMQLSSNPLPHDEHDVPVDVLVSDVAVWSCH